MRTYSCQRRLNWSECDPAGIIFVAHYVRWMVDGVMELFHTLGADPTWMVDPHTRRGLPVVALSTQFHAAPALNQIVTHEIEVVKVGVKSLKFHHRFLRDDVLLMEADETRVWTKHLLADPSQVTSEPIPDNIRALLCGT